MNRRLQLHNILITVLGSNNVYFQPPSTVNMNYPCIVYRRGEINFKTKYAADELYSHRKAYIVTVIDPDPDSEIPDKVLKLPYCGFARHFTADNLNHDVFTLYY